MIAMLGHPELDTEVSGTSMGTVESNDCREMLESDGDTNSILAIMQKEVRFSCKDE